MHFVGCFFYLKKHVSILHFFLFEKNNIASITNAREWSSHTAFFENFPSFLFFICCTVKKNKNKKLLPRQRTVRPPSYKLNKTKTNPQEAITSPEFCQGWTLGRMRWIQGPPELGNKTLSYRKELASTFQTWKRDR